MQRRLAAIMAADVVGYFELIGEDEIGTLAALRRLRKDLFVSSVTIQGGNLIKSMGGLAGRICQCRRSSRLYR